MFIKTEYKNKKTNVFSCFTVSLSWAVITAKDSYVSHLSVSPDKANHERPNALCWHLRNTLTQSHSREFVRTICLTLTHTHRRGLWTVWRLPLLSLWCLSTLPACSRASHSGRPRWVTLPRRDDSVDCQKPSQHYRVLGAPHSQHAARLPDDS